MSVPKYPSCVTLRYQNPFCIGIHTYIFFYWKAGEEFETAIVKSEGHRGLCLLSVSCALNALMITVQLDCLSVRSWDLVEALS